MTLRLVWVFIAICASTPAVAVAGTGAVIGTVTAGPHRTATGGAHVRLRGAADERRTVTDVGRRSLYGSAAEVDRRRAARRAFRGARFVAARRRSEGPAN